MFRVFGNQSSVVFADIESHFLAACLEGKPFQVFDQDPLTAVEIVDLDGSTTRSVF